MRLPDVEHRYVLLTVGENHIEWKDARGIQWHEAFEFFWSQFKAHPGE